MRTAIVVALAVLAALGAALYHTHIVNSPPASLPAWRNVQSHVPRLGQPMRARRYLT